MAAAPIDLSAGLVPKQIDLSAGLVPKNQPDTRSLLQKAKDKFDALTTVTPEQEAGHGAIVNAAQRFGAAAIRGVGAPIVHPADTLDAAGKMLTTNPLTTAHQEVDALYKDPASFAGNAVGGALLGEAASPLIAPVAKAAGKVASRVVLAGKTPEGAMQAAMKPSTVLPQAQRAAMAQTALENSIPVSEAGVQKLGDLIDDLETKKTDIIKANPGRTVDPNVVAKSADAAKARFSKQVNAQGDLDAIESSKQQFLKEQGATNGNPAPPMSAEDAQAMKVGTYRVLKGKYGEQGSASVESQKALAHGLNDEITQQFPEIADVNKAQGSLLDLRPVLERAVARISNRESPVGIGGPILASGVKAAGASTGVAAVAGFLKSVVSIPEVQSRLAIAVSKGAKIPYAMALDRVRSYSASLGSAAASSQGSSTDGSPAQSTSGQP